LVELKLQNLGSAYDFCDHEWKNNFFSLSPPSSKQKLPKEKSFGSLAVCVSLFYTQAHDFAPPSRDEFIGASYL
jgi:hypothetical protein